MSDDHDPEAARRDAGRAGRAGGSAALHRPARRRARQGHPDRALRRAVRGGRRFCAAVMGTDLRHTPVVGGEMGYVDFAIKPDLDTLRARPVAAGGRLVPRRGVDAGRLGALAVVPACAARAGRRRATPSAASRLSSPPSSSSSSPSATRRGRNGLGRYVDELSRVYTVGAVSDPREIVLRMLLWCDELGLEAFAANHEFMNSQYEINVKHSGALDAADRAFMLKAAVKEIAAARGPPRDVHGPAVRRPGRLGLPRPPLAPGEDPPQRVRRRGRRRRAQPARRQLHRGQ